MTSPALQREISTVEQALLIYQDMLNVRLCEEAIRREYPKNQIKTPVHLCNGTEAIVAGTLRCLPARTALYGTYRNHGLYLTQTGDMDGFFAEMFGKRTGPAKGKSGSMHLANPEKNLLFTSAVVATTIPVAAGTALAHQYRGEDRLTAVFFGDGALEEGAFWETLNFACLKKLKLIFVCEDNQLAIHTPAKDRQGFRSVPEALAGFRVAVRSGSAHHPREVMAMVRAVLEQMRADSCPGFLHFSYHRPLEHVGIDEDYAAGYREEPPAEAKRLMDPMVQAEKWVLELGADRQQLDRLHNEIQTRIEKSIQKAQADDFPDDTELYTDVYA